MCSMKKRDLLGLLLLVKLSLGNIILTHNGPGYRIKFKGENIQTNTHGVRYNSFRGIPYAQPPVGELRFRDPKPLEYEGITYVNATAYSMPCSQIDLTKTDELKIFGHEDCLTLDIHTPTTCTDASCPLKPVMVFLHGGSFSMGTGSHYGPELFMDQRNVVLITLNYRLSALGFLSLENWQLSGNQGLKDQLEALKWIHSHIRTFGGDPNKITLFGHAAGAQSVHAHLLTNLGQGLFQGAILQSGAMPILVHPMLAKQTEQSSRTLLKLLDCNRQYMQDVMNCLQNRNLEDIFVHLMPKSNIMDALTSAQRENEAPGLVFGPVIDTYALVPFLPDNPWQLMMEQRFKRMPIMMGACKDEGTLYVPSLWNRINEANNLWNDISAKIFLSKAGKSLTDLENTVLNVLKRYYLGNNYVSMDMKQDLLDIVSDGLTLSPLHETAQSFVSSNVPVYFYELTHRPSFSYSQLYGAPFGTRDIDFGVSHGDDLLLMFNVSFLRTINPIETEGDVKVSNHLLKLWTNFAQHGNPTPTATDSFPLWKTFTNAQEHVFEIGDQLILDDQARFHDRMFLWRNIFWNTLFNRTRADLKRVVPLIPPSLPPLQTNQNSFDSSSYQGQAVSPNNNPVNQLFGVQGTSMVQATTPPYLALEGYRECLGKVQDGSAQMYCLPQNRPGMCPMDTWYRLQTTFQGDSCDDRVMNAPNSASYGPPSYLSLPYSEQCFDKVNAGPSVTRCLPPVRPHGCPFKTWETIKRTFPGKSCQELENELPPSPGTMRTTTTSTTARPQNMEYLMVNGLDRCMGMRNDGGQIHHCLPYRKPEYCDFESWNKLLKTFEGSRCDGSKRVPGSIQGSGVPNYMAIEGHRDCLKSVRNGADGGFIPCKPRLKPTFCLEETWHQLQRSFKGRTCASSSNTIRITSEEYDDCLGSYRAGFQGWDLCVPRKRPKFCSDDAWIRLQFESDKDVCPHQADTMNFDFISCQSDIECPIHRRKCFRSELLRIQGVCVPKRCEGDIDCPRIGGNADGTFVAGYCRNQYGICHYDRIIESK
ncbi:neuroligin-4, Y-linked-like [Tigriopus californicus]|nr:neuroligin-4, Y-linked-like [Tigriopus californicus]